MGHPRPGVPRRPPLLEVEDLSFEAGGARILRGVSFVLDPGELVAVMGASGSGKTTLLKCLNRLLEPGGGRARLDGIDVRDIPPVELRRRVGMVAQVPFMFDGTVRENLQRAADFGGIRPTGEELARLLADAGLDEDLERDAGSLSIGQQQRVAMARALVSRPSVLLCDEPTASLDPASSLRLESTLTGMSAAGVGIVFVTHDPAQAARIADRRLRLEDGRLHVMEDDDRRRLEA